MTGPESSFAEPQWIDKRKVHAMLQHEYEQVPPSASVKPGGWQEGLPRDERRYLDGFKAAVAYIDRIVGGWGWSSTSGVAGTLIDDEREEAEDAVIRAAKQFCDHEPLSARKQPGHRVGLHRAVAKLREIERS